VEIKSSIINTSSFAKYIEVLHGSVDRRGERMDGVVDSITN